MKLNIKLVSIIVIAILIVGGVGSGYFFYTKFQETNKILNNPDEIAKKDEKAIIDKIKVLVDVPNDETPSVATVLDVEKLKDQAFFARAQNGDKVIVYSNAKRAILFRPSTNKVIEVSSISLNSADTSPQVETKIKVNIYNGTSTTGLTQSAQTKLAPLTNIEVAERLNAVKKDYTDTLVVDLTKTNGDTAKSIASALGGTVADALPEGEKLPSDNSIGMVVILGSSYAK